MKTIKSTYLLLTLLISLAFIISAWAFNTPETEIAQTSQPRYEYCQLVETQRAKNLLGSEYAYTYRVDYGDKKEDEYHDGHEVEALDYLGSQGWELVVVRSEAGDMWRDVYYQLKRRVK